MNTFPVIDSTLSASHLSIWVKEKYGLPSGTTCRLFRTNMNHTYIVWEPEKKYVLRIYSYNKRTFTDIAEEVRLLNLLKEAGIRVSYPIPDVSNHYIQSLDAPEGTRYAVLFSFGQGAKIRNLTVELSYQIGQLMANMHQATHNQRIDRTVYTADYLGHQAYGQVKPYFSESLEEMKFIKGAAEKLVSVFDHSPAPDLRQGIVHLDIWYDNMSITESGEITLFDFDNCGNGWLVLDIGYFCMQLFYTQPDKKEYEKKFAAFLNGYREAAPLSDQEISLIPYAGLAIWIYYLGVQAQRFDNFSNIFFTENYLKMYMGRVREWLTYTHTEPIIV